MKKIIFCFVLLVMVANSYCQIKKATAINKDAVNANYIQTAIVSGNFVYPEIAYKGFDKSLDALINARAFILEGNTLISELKIKLVLKPVKSKRIGFDGTKNFYYEIQGLPFDKEIFISIFPATGTDWKIYNNDGLLSSCYKGGDACFIWANSNIFHVNYNNVAGLRASGQIFFFSSTKTTVNNPVEIGYTKITAADGGGN